MLKEKQAPEELFCVILVKNVTVGWGAMGEDLHPVMGLFVAGDL